MNELMIFNNPEFGEIRTIDENGVVLFCGADVARALGYAKPRNAIATHCKGALKRGGVSQTTNQYGVTTEQEVEMVFIPESDLYRLVFSSKLPSAEKFTDWVTQEVLPSIRKNGGYIQTTPEMTPEEIMAKALILANATIENQKARLGEMAAQNSALTVQNQIMAPKADYFDELVERNTLTNFRETAKELDIPPKKFVQFLLDKKYIYRDQKGKLLPYENKNTGLFEVKETFNEKTRWSGTQTLVTPKGRETFRLLYLKAA